MPSPLSNSDMQDIRGQWHVKRALEVVAAGGHAILLIGPPGAGKMALARALPSLMPQRDPPFAFRAPHAGLSLTAFAGSVKTARPGELSLAQGGYSFSNLWRIVRLPILPKYVRRLRNRQ